MPEKFIVPQFIDNEDKILGPITVRQFLIMLVTVFLVFIEYEILKYVFAYFVILGLISFAIGAVFSFVRMNGQPFHKFFINFLQTRLRPGLRVWHKELNDTELRALLVEKKEVAAIVHVPKPPPATTRLRDLALTVNTGGVYNAEDDEK